MPRLALVTNNVDFVVTHRLPILRAAAADGFDLHVIAPDGAGADTVRATGAQFHPFSLNRKGQNPIEEATTVARLTQLYRRVAPDLVHHVTIKPILYGTLASRLAGVPGVVNAVSGLGTVFLAKGLRAQARRRAVAAAYRVAFSHPRSVVIFQNDADEAELRRLGAIGRANIVMIRGSGVDLTRFFPTPEPDGVPLVMFPARLLRDKGVCEFVSAARHLKSQGIEARFVLVGGVDDGNPTAISKSEVDQWVATNAVEWWGHQRDMVPMYRQATVVCLPSYREGMSKTLLEAAACGRAIVTSDAPGCREVVDGGRLGPLVPVGDSAALARALRTLIENSEERRRLAQGLAEYAKATFSDVEVARRHLAVYREVLKAPL